MVLQVSEELTISTVANEKVRLMAALGHGEDLEVDGRQVREIDVAGLQILLAAKLEVEERGRAFSLRATMCSAPLAEALALAALADALVTARPVTEGKHG